MHDPLRYGNCDPVTSVYGISHRYVLPHLPSKCSTRHECAEQCEYMDNDQASLQSAMALRFSDGGYVAQMFAYESDTLRLLRDVQVHVAAGNALYAAVYLCRYSGQPSAIEKRAIIQASPLHCHLDHDQRIDSASPGIHALPTGDLTLTLLHVDTTWRFDSYDSRRASPKLSWPAIRRLFTPGAFVEGDLILRDQHCHRDAQRILRKSFMNYIHVLFGPSEHSLTRFNSTCSPSLTYRDQLWHADQRSRQAHRTAAEE